MTNGNGNGNGNGAPSKSGSNHGNGHNKVEVQVEVVRAPVPAKVQTLDLDVLSELAGCTTEELVDGFHQDRHAVDIAGAVVDNTSSASRVQTPGQHPHSRKDSDDSGVVSAGVAFESTIKVTEEQPLDDLRSSHSFASKRDDEDASYKGSSGHGSATYQHAATGSTTTTTFICKPPKAYHASALVLATPPTLDNDGEVNHTAESTYDCNEHAQIHVTNERAPDQFRGFLIGVDHYGNSEDFIASLTDDEDDEDDDDKIAQQREARPLLKDGDEEAAFLVKEADSSELHPVAFSIPVTTSTTDASASGAPPTIHEHGSSTTGNASSSAADAPVDYSQEAEGGGGAQLIASSSASQDDLPDPSDAAYLIQVDDGTTEEPRVYLAVPDHDQDSSNLYFPSMDDRRESILDRTLDYALPSDVAQVAVKTVGDDHEVRMVVEHKTPLMGYLLLAMALLSMSSLGAALDMIQGASPLLKLYWRMSSDCVFFLPMALLSLARDGRPKLTRTDYTHFLVAGLCYCVFSGGFLISLDYTVIGTAFLFGNCHSLFLVLGKMLSGAAVVCLEGTGAFVGLLGAVLCTLDAPAPIGNQHLEPMKGDLFALASALGGCGYLLMAKKLRPKVDLFVFMFSLLFVGSLVVLVLMHVAGIHYTLDRNHSHGMWGWTDFSSDRLPMQLYTTLVCDLIGMTGYIAVMKYFDPLVVSVIMLLEPVVATVIGLLVGVGGIPGSWTVIGGSIVTMGTLMVTAASSNKTETYKIQKALHLLKSIKALPNKTRRKKSANYGAVDKNI